jgi:hypothetical protein
MLAEEAGVSTTAALGAPGIPGGPTAPGLPEGANGTSMAALWFGMPYLRAARKARVLKIWRSGPWNT